jgi:hypothetical protein
MGNSLHAAKSLGEMKINLSSGKVSGGRKADKRGLAISERVGEAATLVTDARFFNGAEMKRATSIRPDQAQNSGFLRREVS